MTTPKTSPQSDLPEGTREPAWLTVSPPGGLGDGRRRVLIQAAMVMLAHILCLRRFVRTEQDFQYYL